MSRRLSLLAFNVRRGSLGPAGALGRYETPPLQLRRIGFSLFCGRGVNFYLRNRSALRILLSLRDPITFEETNRANPACRLYRDVRAYAIPGGSEEIMLDLSIRQAMRVHKVLGMKL